MLGKWLPVLILMASCSNAAKAVNPMKDSLPKGIVINDFGDLNSDENFEGLYMRTQRGSKPGKERIEIEGVCGIFVNPGAAMATWGDFPESITFQVRDADTGKVFRSEHMEEDTSWAMDPDGEEPDFGPTNRVVQERFSVDLINKIPELKDVIRPQTKLVVSARFEALSSNELLITFD